MICVKFKTTGRKMIKYAVSFWIINALALLFWITIYVIPYGKEFISMLEQSLNNGLWNLSNLFSPFLWVVVSFLILEACIAFITFVFIYPLAKRSL